MTSANIGVMKLAPTDGSAGKGQRRRTPNTVKEYYKVEILSQATGGNWQPLEDPTADNPALPKAVQLITNLMLSEHLLVLCGLGSSMYLCNSEGNKIAPTMKDLWDMAALIGGESFQSILQDAHYILDPGQDGNIEDLLSHCQMVLKLEEKASIRNFVAESERQIAVRCRFPITGSHPYVHESFLRKVARRSPRLPRTRIFTTNYDLCFEVAASNSRFVMIDGFSHSFPQEFDGSYFGYDLVKRDHDKEAPDYITNVFHLYKVHGSVDWEKKGNHIVKKPDTDSPCLVYPRMGKYQSSYEHPYGEMMSRFQMSLRQPNTGLLICGFGFNDSHVVHPILSAIQSNVSLRVMIANPSVKAPFEGSDCRKDEIKWIEALIKQGDHRLSMITAPFEDFVPLIPDLVAETEEEIYFRRIQQIGGGTSA